MNDKDKPNPGLITAYESNTRKQSADSPIISSGWHTKIDQLLGEGYSFLPYQYSETGVLFRAMNTGLVNAIQKQKFGLFDDDNPHVPMEHNLEIYFVSHELSDAMSIARLWGEAQDAAILCITSRVFNAYNAVKRAAVMAFAEPGVVFKYPFFVEPIAINDIFKVFINEMTYTRLITELSDDELKRVKPLLSIIPTKQLLQNRRATEQHIMSVLGQDKHHAAIPMHTKHYPKK